MIGICLPNDTISPTELTRILKLGCKSYVLYVTAFDAASLSRYNILLARLAQGAGGAANITVHVRVEARGPLTALVDSQRLKLVHDALGGRYYSICVRNEPNIESIATPSQYGIYVRDLINAVDPSIRNKLALAPISPKEGYLDWVKAGITFGGILTKHHIHVYGDPKQSALLFETFRSLWAKEIICTEHNFGAGRLYSQQAWADDLPAVLSAANQSGIQSVNVFIWRWKTPDMHLPTPVNVIDSPMEAAITQAASVATWTNYTSPNHEGPRTKTLGIVLHSTRGGLLDYEKEFNATLTWFNMVSSSASTHVVVSPTRVAYPVHDELIAWHSGDKNDLAKSLNPTHLGMELCQGKLGMVIPESEFKLAALEAAKLCVKYSIRPVHALDGLIEHYETEAGISYGKSDIKSPFDMARFVTTVNDIVQSIINPIDWSKIHAYADWALARIANHQDPRIKADFITHLHDLGADYNTPNMYGWPG